MYGGKCVVVFCFPFIIHCLLSVWWTSTTAIQGWRWHGKACGRAGWSWEPGLLANRIICSFHSFRHLCLSPGFILNGQFHVGLSFEIIERGKELKGYLWYTIPNWNSYNKGYHLIFYTAKMTLVLFTSLRGVLLQWWVRQGWYQPSNPCICWTLN